MVAGVDYAVGIKPTAYPLKDPATAIDGSTVQDISSAGSGNKIRITADVTLDGYDFSMTGPQGAGWAVQIVGGNVTITNSLFKGFSTNDRPLLECGVGARAVNIRYCEFNGNSLNTSLATSNRGYDWLFSNGGPSYFEYNYCHHAAIRYGEWSSGSGNFGQTMYMRYNVFTTNMENTVTTGGTHGNGFLTSISSETGTVWEFHFDFNVFRQPDMPPMVGGGSNMLFLAGEVSGTTTSATTNSTLLTFAAPAPSTTWQIGAEAFTSPGGGIDDGGPKIASINIAAHTVTLDTPVTVASGTAVFFVMQRFAHGTSFNNNVWIAPAVTVDIAPQGVTTVDTTGSPSTTLTFGAGRPPGPLLGGLAQGTGLSNQEVVAFDSTSVTLASAVGVASGTTVTIVLSNNNIFFTGIDRAQHLIGGGNNQMQFRDNFIDSQGNCITGQQLRRILSFNTWYDVSTTTATGGPRLSITGNVDMNKGTGIRYNTGNPINPLWDEPA
jgi:hypothetical protein